MSSLETRQDDGILIVKFKDNKILDDARIQQIGAELLECATQAAQVDPKRIVVNFDGVNFMGSAMIGKLVLLNRQCTTHGVALKMCNISKNIAEVFKITRLNRVFEIHKDEDKAIKSFDKKGLFGLG